MQSWTLLLEDLRNIVSNAAPRVQRLQRIAASIRRSGNYRWVGLYDVDETAMTVINVGWDGQGAPEYPGFPTTKGLTGAAIREQRSINVGDVNSDSRYLTAFGSTRSEIIVPIFTANKEKVVGTIDVKNEEMNAFSGDTEELLAACSEVIQPLWADW